MKLVLVRAASPSFDGRLVGRATVPLSPEGQERARAAAGLIHARGEASTVYATASGHAGEAATIVAQALEAKLVPTDDLVELGLGLWEGLPEPELARRHKSAFRAFLIDARAVVPPEAEEVDVALARLLRVLGRVRKRHARDPKWVSLVVPELAFALLAAGAEGKAAPPDLWRLRLEGPDVRFFELA